MEIETVEHILFSCDHNSIIRNQELYSIINKSIEDIFQDINSTKRLSKFIIESFKDRH